MSSEWKEYQLDEIAELSGGYAFKSEEYTDSGCFVLRTVNIKDDGRITRDGATFVDNQAIDKYKRFLLQDLDTLFVMVGATLGKTGLVRANNLPALLNQNMWVIRAINNNVDPLFLHYSFKFSSHSLMGLASGSARGFFKRDDFRRMRIKTPSFKEQKIISGILGALDEKIDILRETNTTLEAIAQALFKSWFVDFDPVHAKQQGRAPEGMDAQTAALFPDSFEASELGMVPKGWRVGAFAELIKLHKGSVNPSASPSTIFQHYSLPAYDAAQLPVAELGSEIKSNKTSVPIDGVLLSKLNPHIPRVWLPSKVEEYSVCSTEFLPFVPVNGATTALVYTWLSSVGFIAELSQLVTGTSNSHQRIKPDSVLSMQVVTPPKNVMQGFDVVVAPLFEKVKANRLMAYSLSSLRDTLLPRLISGQLRLPEAQVLVEDAVDA